MTDKPYPKVPGIDASLFELTDWKMPERQYKDAHAQLKAYETQQQINFLGYQTNQDVNYKDSLQDYLNIQINNIGDPFTQGNFTTNTKFMEREVLDYFAKLWHIPEGHRYHDEHDPESYWGYVVSMGSSESNIFGFWNARDYLQGKKLLPDPEAAEQARQASLANPGTPYAVEPRILTYRPETPPPPAENMYTPVAFYSQDTHYSVIKCMKMFEIPTFYELGSQITKASPTDKCPLRWNPTHPDVHDYPDGYSEQGIDPTSGWPREVPSELDGSICIKSLVRLVHFFVEKGYPIILNFNYGTTFKGAYDRVLDAVNALKEDYLLTDAGGFDPYIGIPRERNNYWVHIDGALGAGYMPYQEMTDSTDFPVFDFRIDEVCSITMSGHKYPGAPWPCGVYMSKTKYQLKPPSNPHYLGAPDSTLAGSRNGFSAMVLWDYIAKRSYDTEKEKTYNSQKAANILTSRLRALLMETWVEHTPNTFSVRFKKVAPDLVFKYSLSAEVVYVDGEQREYNHVYCMGHVDEALINRFMHDIEIHPDPFPEQHLNPAFDPADYEPTATPADGQAGLYVPQSGRGFK